LLAIGGSLATVITSEGGQAITLATSGGGVVTSFAGHHYTVATAAASSISAKCVHNRSLFSSTIHLQCRLIRQSSITKPPPWHGRNRNWSCHHFRMISQTLYFYPTD
jgi:hypothetical protein